MGDENKVAKGSFESVYGPWRPGVNKLILNAFEQEPFKGAVLDIGLQAGDGASAEYETLHIPITLVASA